MNNVQFYLLLSPAIGSLVLVVLAWLHQNSRLTDLRNDNDRRFGDVNRSFDDVTRRFGEVNQRFDDVTRRFGEVNQRFDDVTRRFEDRFDGVDAKLAALTSDYRTFYGMEQKLEGRVEELSKRVA